MAKTQFPPPLTVVGPTPPAPNADLVTAAYNYVGRSGFGSAPNNIDQAGYLYWLGRLDGGMSQHDFARTFCSAIAGAIAQPHTDSTPPVVDYVRGYCTLNKVQLVGIYDF